MPRPSIAQLRHMLVNEGKDLDTLLAENSSGGADATSEPAAKMPDIMDKPVDKASETPMQAEDAMEKAEAESTDEQAAEPVEGVEEIVETVDPKVIADLEEYGPPDTWTVETMRLLEPSARAACKAAWATMEPAEQARIKASARMRKQGQKAAPKGLAAIRGTM